jgi:hypothetical protein
MAAGGVFGAGQAPAQNPEAQTTREPPERELPDLLPGSSWWMAPERKIPRACSSIEGCMAQS